MRSRCAASFSIHGRKLSEKECAAELCIHKNTVLYRINKLAEQFGVDLKNVRTLASAYVSLLLLEREKQ